MTPLAAARAVEVGDLAPDFTLKDQNAQEVTLSSFRGKQAVVLAFYPFDFSPVCTTEHCALTEDLSQFAQTGAVVLGISCDSWFTHKAWQEKLGLQHSLLSDLKREVCRRYGLYLPDLNCATRATIVVGQDGTVIYTKVQALKVARVNQEIVGALR